MQIVHASVDAQLHRGRVDGERMIEDKIIYVVIGFILYWVTGPVLLLVYFAITDWFKKIRYRRWCRAHPPLPFADIGDWITFVTGVTDLRRGIDPGKKDP